MTKEQGDTIISFLKGICVLLAITLGGIIFELQTIAGKLPH